MDAQMDVGVAVEDADDVGTIATPVVALFPKVLAALFSAFASGAGAGVVTDNSMPNGWVSEAGTGVPELGPVEALGCRGVLLAVVL